MPCVRLVQSNIVCEIKSEGLFALCFLRARVYTKIHLNEPCGDLLRACDGDFSNGNEIIKGRL